MNRLKLPLILVLAAAVVALVAAFTTRTSTATKATVLSPAQAALALQNTFVNVYKNVSPSVVQIKTQSGLGSGIVFDSKGDIVTNDHVVNGATSLSVTTSAGKTLPAKLVGEFAEDDLAVIKVDGSGLHPASFADSSNLKVGSIAIAIGNPLGLSSSVTQGIVSAIHRQAPEGNGTTLQDAIQTSAPINPGNSGGALTDVYGRVIGIPTLAAQDPQFGGAAAGIGFAIPSNVVKDIAGQLISNGKVVNSHRAFLGITIGDTGEGVYVGSVTAGSGAAKAGIVTGDVITALAGKPTLTSDDLGSVLATLKPGQTVNVDITHQDGSKATVSVTLGQYPGTSGG